MAGRSRLRDGAPRLLGKHDSIRGKWYRECWAALIAELGPIEGLRRLEAGRVCITWVNPRASTQALEDARRRRKPWNKVIACLARRQGIDDGAYGQALEHLRHLVGAKRPPANALRPDGAVAREHGGQG